MSSQDKNIGESKHEREGERSRGSGVLRTYRPIIGIALASLIICGLLFPLLITAISQVAMPYQANGEIVTLNGKEIGSNLIDNNFTQPVFFHARNNSASGVDPDITIPEAYSQIPRISSATGIAQSEILAIINDNELGTFWVFGSPYANVLKLNLVLIRDYPSVYKNYTLG